MARNKVKRKTCHRCGATISGEHYTLHMERVGKGITVIDDAIYCKRCGDKIAKATGMLQ